MQQGRTRLSLAEDLKALLTPPSEPMCPVCRLVRTLPEDSARWLERACQELSVRALQEVLTKHEIAIADKRIYNHRRYCEYIYLDPQE